MGADELAQWQVYERLYDLPDGYYVAAMVAAYNSAKAIKLGEAIPYYKPAASARSDVVARLRRRMEQINDGRH